MTDLEITILAAGTKLYHGTAAEDEFEELFGPAWVSESEVVVRSGLRLSRIPWNPGHLTAVLSDSRLRVHLGHELPLRVSEAAACRRRTG